MKTPKYNSIEKCLKCGAETNLPEDSNGHITRIVDQKYNKPIKSELTSEEHLNIVPERLRVVCRTCRFYWYELCKDYKETKSSIQEKTRT